MKSIDHAKILAPLLLARGWKIALAESCTGGLVCATLTELSGSSEWFERGYITYSNQAKTECLGVPDALIQADGAVSEPVAKAMAQGAQRNARVHVGVSITGIAGPTGGTAEKPVGTVCFGWAIPNAKGEHVITSETKLFSGDRQSIREQATEHALVGLLQLLNN
jgi:nicotinamide-nucleotide amidase